MRRWGTAVALFVFWAGHASGADWSGRVRFQLGEEYDTNVHRVYAAEPQSDGAEGHFDVSPDGLTRLVLQGQLRCAAENHMFLVEYLGGLKLFHHQPSENMIANQFEGSYTYTGGQTWRLGSRLMLLDTLLALHDRDYRLINGEVFERFEVSRGFTIETFQGLRHFLFKPDVYGDVNYEYKFSHLGPLLGIRFGVKRSQSFSASLYYQVDWRFFEQPTAAGSEARLDTRHEVGLPLRLDLHYWGKKRLIVQVIPVLSFNQSNSPGSSLVWYRMKLVGAVQLPLNLTLQLMGTLQFTSYPDGIFLDRFLYEPNADENENSLMVRLALLLWDHVSLVLQGGLYRNYFVSEQALPRFGRETFMLGLVYELPL